VASLHGITCSINIWQHPISHLLPSQCNLLHPFHLLHPLPLLHLPECFCLNLLILLVLVILVLLYSAVDVAVGVVIFMTFEGAAS
jgi:hypothetical protein